MSDMVENKIYGYIAIFTFCKDGIVIEFPDFPGCCPCADKDDIEGALKNANEALKLHIYTLTLKQLVAVMLFMMW